MKKSYVFFMQMSWEINGNFLGNRETNRKMKKLLFYMFIHKNMYKMDRINKFISFKTRSVWNVWLCKGLFRNIF